MKPHRPSPAAHGGDFPQTRHTLLSLIRSDETGARRRGIDQLVAAYWKPVYKYVRLRWHESPHDAEDLTQGFFSQAIQATLFDDYDPSRGRFRTYLRTCVDRFVLNARAYANRARRGGGADHLPLDFTTAEGELHELPLPSSQDPETLFRDEWVRRLFELAIADLGEHCAAAGKELSFRLFERYDLDPPESHESRVTYDTLAAEFGVSTTQVTNLLADARRRFRAALMERVRQSTASDAEFREELMDLLGFGPGDAR